MQKIILFFQVLFESLYIFADMNKKIAFIIFITIIVAFFFLIEFLLK